MTRKPRKSIYDKDHPEAIKARDRVIEIIDSVEPEDLVTAIKGAPSLRGMILGYIAELMFDKHVLRKNRKISDIKEYDDHDRSANKVDRSFVLGGKTIRVQLKSIETNSIRWHNEKQCLTAEVQNGGSDKRDVKLPNGHVVNTTNCRIGEYDILAVPLLPYTGTWDFAYKLNRECRLTESTKYADEDRQFLLATTEILTYPLEGDWLTSLEKICARL